MPGLLGATATYAVLVPVAETAEGLSLLYEVRSPALHLRSEALMHPVLGQVAPAALERLRLNPAEVRQTFLVSLDWLAAHPPEVYRYPLLPVGAEQFPYARVQAPPDYRWTPGQVEVPVYDGLPYPLWGLTARITRHVVQRATEGAE